MPLIVASTRPIEGAFDVVFVADSREYLARVRFSSGEIPVASKSKFLHGAPRG
jgi:hypothetical protein